MIRQAGFILVGGVLVAALGVPMPVAAQTVATPAVQPSASSSTTGTVVDISGAVVPDAEVVVKTSAPLRLFERTLRPRSPLDYARGDPELVEGSGQALRRRCELVELRCDAGMVQIDSLNVDTEESIRQAVEFQKQLPAVAAAEAAYLRRTGAHVVVGDIPPLAFAAANAAGIPSIAIGNFTWDWIYDQPFAVRTNCARSSPELGSHPAPAGTRI